MDPISILLTVAIAVVIAALVIYCIDLVGLPAPFPMILKVFVVIVAIAYIVRTTGLA